MSRLLIHKQIDHLKPGHIHQAEVGEAQFGDDDEGEQAELHVGVVQGAAAFSHRRDHAGGFVGHDFSAFVGHEASDGQFDEGNFLAIFEDDDPAADCAEAVGGQGHVGFAGAGDDHMVAVVGDGGGDGAGRVEAKALHEAVGDAAGGLMPLDQGNLAYVLLRIARHKPFSTGRTRMRARVGA